MVWQQALKTQTLCLPDDVSQTRQGPAGQRVGVEILLASPGAPYANNWDGPLPPLTLAPATETAELCKGVEG